VLIGLRDGTISKDGLDTFKLGYEFVSDARRPRTMPGPSSSRSV